MALIVIVGIAIVWFAIIARTNNVKYIEINKEIQNKQCLSQPVILKNGQIIFAQINMSYHIIDLKKAKNVVRNGTIISMKLEYQGITELRKIVDEIDNIEKFNIKIQNDLKNRLSEIGQDLGVEIIKLHIKFGEQKDFDIGNKSYNSSIEDISDNKHEETTDAKYNFEVSMKTIWSKYGPSKKTIFKTKINIQNNKLNYKLSRNYENSDNWLKHLEKKYNSFTEGTQDIYVDDILSIKYKVGFAFALTFFDFIVFLCAILGIIFPLIGQISFLGITNVGLQGIPINFIYIPSGIIMLLLTILFISYFTCKCLEIKYRSEQGIQKIIFPISRAIFASVPDSIQTQVKTLGEEISQKNQDITIKKDRLKWIPIIYSIMVLMIYI